MVKSRGKLSKELGLGKLLICHWARAYRDKGEIGLEGLRDFFKSVFKFQRLVSKLNYKAPVQFRLDRGTYHLAGVFVIQKQAHND